MLKNLTFLQIILFLVSYTTKSQSYYFAPNTNQQSFFFLTNPALTAVDIKLKSGVSYNNQWNTFQEENNSFRTLISFFEYSTKVQERQSQAKTNPSFFEYSTKVQERRIQAKTNPNKGRSKLFNSFRGGRHRYKRKSKNNSKGRSKLFNSFRGGGHRYKRKSKNNSRWGFGLVAFHDREGILTTNSLNLSIAYHLQILGNFFTDLGIGYGYNWQGYSKGIYIDNFNSGNLSPSFINDQSYEQFALGMAFRYNPFFTIGYSYRNILYKNILEANDQFNHQHNIQLSKSIFTSSRLIKESQEANVFKEFRSEILADIRNWNNSWQSVFSLRAVQKYATTSLNGALSLRGIFTGYQDLILTLGFDKFEEIRTGQGNSEQRSNRGWSFQFHYGTDITGIISGNRFPNSDFFQITIFYRMYTGIRFCSLFL